MFDPQRILDQFLGGGAPAGQQEPGQPQPNSAGGMFGRVGDYARENPMLAGGAAGGLAALLLGSKAGREIGGNALKYGGAAVLGGLAYKAYRDWQASQSASQPAPTPAPAQLSRSSVPVLPPPADSPFAPAQAPGGEAKLAETLVVAMIAAAKADGHIDAEERGRIYERLEQGGLGHEEVAFVQHELKAPIDVDRLARAATTPEIAVEIYAASLLAIRSDTPAEKGYLAMLAGRLGLEPELVRSIEATVEGAAPPAAA